MERQRVIGMFAQHAVVCNECSPFTFSVMHLYGWRPVFEQDAEKHSLRCGTCWLLLVDTIKPEPRYVRHLEDCLKLSAADVPGVEL